MKRNNILLIIAGILIVFESIMIILLSMTISTIHDESVMNCELSNIHAEASNILIEVLENTGEIKKGELEKFELSNCGEVINPSLRIKLKEIKQ